MTTSQPAQIYLIVEFDWPNQLQEEHGRKARALHDAVQGQTWIKEIVAASGGIGGGPSSLWIFQLENYAALDRLLRDPEDRVGQAYTAFFSEMPVVHDRVKVEVLFI
jgi:hypothetical protein